MIRCKWEGIPAINSNLILSRRISVLFDTAVTVKTSLVLIKSTLISKSFVDAFRAIIVDQSDSGWT